MAFSSAPLGLLLRLLRMKVILRVHSKAKQFLVLLKMLSKSDLLNLMSSWSHGLSDIWLQLLWRLGGSADARAPPAKVSMHCSGWLGSDLLSVGLSHCQKSASAFLQPGSLCFSAARVLSSWAFLAFACFSCAFHPSFCSLCCCLWGQP